MDKTLITGSLIAVLATAPVCFAAQVAQSTPTCSIHPGKDVTDAQYASLAKISQADAEKRGLARVKVPAKVLGSELQVEDGCLVWTLIVKESGKSGMRSIKLDAGTGKVLSSKHESGK